MAEMSDADLIASFYDDDEPGKASPYGAQGQRSAGVSLGDLQMKATTAPVRSPAREQVGFCCNSDTWARYGVRSGPRCAALWFLNPKA